VQDDNAGMKKTDKNIPYYAGAKNIKEKEDKDWFLRRLFRRLRAAIKRRVKKEGLRRERD
jgi:hypothetical protein